MTNKKGFVPVAIILIVIGVLALGGGVWYYKNQIAKIKSQTNFNNQTQNQQTNQQPVEKDETADWKTYRNEKYGFEVKYPNNWKFLEEEPVVDEVNKELMSVAMIDSLHTFRIVIDQNQPSGFIFDLSNIQKPVVVDGLDVTAYIFPNGYECYDEIRPENGDCSFFEIPIKSENLWYRLIGAGDAKNTDSYSRILSTFKFID